jgi:hypothetical protein
MQVGLGLVYEESKGYHQHRPARRAYSVPGAGDAAGKKLVPRSEMHCRLHRPYKEEEGDLGFAVADSPSGK